MPTKPNDSAKPVPSVRFAANDVRLSPRQWVVTAILSLCACWLIPLAWQVGKPLETGPDYRLPYRLGNDYWSYERTCRQSCQGNATLLIGDSVLWGHYVDCDGTLSHYLNQGDGEHQFANLAVDGIHPVALSGLIEQYGSAVENKRVILNCNLLWISSPRHDLSTEKEASFNHPALVPQFWPQIQCYRASLSERLGIVMSRHLGILAWADHLRIAYFDSDNLPTWTIEHPDGSMLRPWTLALPSPDELPSPTPDIRPWTDKRIRPMTPDWVPLEHSLQWQFFRRTVELLQQRGNEVFVLIGPLNEHMLTDVGLAEYQQRKQQVIDWHNEHGIPHFAPPPLPSKVYADLSHPVSEGYAQLAQSLLKQTSFRSFLADR